MSGSSGLKPVVAETQQESTIIYIQAVYPSIIKYKGRVSGKLYTWNGAGDVVAVDSEDAPFLLPLRIGGKSCCGGANRDGNKLFEEYKESA